MHVPNDALVLVADGCKWILVRNHGDGDLIDLRTDSDDDRRDRKDSEIKSDAPGTQGQRFGHGRPTLDETDFHQQEEDRFAAGIADMLKQRALSGDFDRLIVVAAPRTLGTLRAHWHKEVAARVMTEIPRDLTDHPTPEIEAALNGTSHPPD